MAEDLERPGAEEWVPAEGGLAALREAAPGCRGCELWQDATQVVFSTGGSRARLVLVGEQPGDQEDRTGEPFVGPAGRVLDDALEAAQIPRRDVYLTNAVKHFRHEPAAPGKRRIHAKPAVGHIVACRPWLEAELDVVKPKVVVCLGGTAARSVLGRTVSVARERGRVLAGGAYGGSVVVTMHPSALLRLRGPGGWDEAFDALVRDLDCAHTAAASAQSGRAGRNSNGRNSNGRNNNG